MKCTLPETDANAQKSGLKRKPFSKTQLSEKQIVNEENDTALD
jgi:hypothetical protein